MESAMANPGDVLKPGDALLIVDVQRDFCPGGALPIEHGDRVVAPLNRWTAAAAAAGVPVYASRDWHPLHHPSFVSHGGPWPVHCLQDSDGAQFHPDLALPDGTVVVTKGTRFDHDQYSAFDDTGLDVELRARGIERLWIAGLAQDVCVRATVLDARREGFAVVVIEDATRPVSAENGATADTEMRQAGARFERTS
jgi:nicotinamidase/pyrazinamidase